jgi:large subunit ribosomal protein L9
MEIILRAKVEKLGNRGEVVKVSDGYARNYLFPKKLALLANETNKKQVEQEKAAAVRRDTLEKAESEALAGQLSKVVVSVSRKVGENDVLYGSVTSMDIAEGLEAQGFKVDRRKIVLEEALKNLGQHSVAIKLPHEVTASITVEVLREE